MNCICRRLKYCGNPCDGKQSDFVCYKPKLVSFRQYDERDYTSKYNHEYYLRVTKIKRAFKKIALSKERR